MTDKTDNTSVQLARHLGVFEATMIGVGAMIGAGIFVLTGIASGKAGPAAILAFFLNGIVTLFTALSYAELSSAIPEAGGGYSFVKKVMPNSVAFISGWMLWFAYVVACSLYAKGFGSYFFEFFHRYVPTITHFLNSTLGHGISVSLLTVLIGILFLGINIIGAHASGQAENYMTIGKILILLLFIGFGTWAILQDTETTRNNMVPFLPNGFNGVIAAMGLTFIAFEGYDLIATVSEEVKEPRKNIPKAILFSLAITIVIYLAVVFVSLGAVPPQGGIPTWKMLGNYGEIGIVQAAQNFMPKAGVIIVLAGGLFATLSALNATIMASSRVAFSMGRDWMLPNVLSQIHASRKTPVMAICLSGFLFLSVAIFLPLETIGTASSLLFLLTFVLVNASLIMYRSRSTKEPPPFQTPLYPLVPILGILTCSGLAIFQMFHEWIAWGLAAGWVLFGWIIYMIFFSRRADISDVSRTIESPELMSLKKIKGYKILLPLANPERVEPLMNMGGQIAGKGKGEVIALSIVDLPDVTAYSEAEPFVKDSRRTLEIAQEFAIRKSISFSSLLKIGRSAPGEIVKTATENQCDLILLGFKKEGDPLENSVIHRVIKRQPCDVAILKSSSDSTENFQNILIPIAGKEVHDRLKVRVVHSLIGPGSGKVTFLTVVDPGAGEPEKNRANANLERAAKIYDVQNYELVLKENRSTVDAIVENARDQDLLILGMRKEPLFQSFFFGSFTERITNQVPCPTLLTKSYDRKQSFLKSIFD